MPGTPDVGMVVIVAEQHDGRLVVFQWRHFSDRGGGAPDLDWAFSQVGPGKRFRRAQASEVYKPGDLGAIR